MPKNNTKQPTGERPKLTRAQARRMVESWVLPFLSDDETIGDFLLLLRTLALEPDAIERESIFIEAEAALMPFAPSISSAVGDLIARRAALLSPSVH